VPTYAVGDIQGCYRTFKKLLKRIEFDEAADRLWLVGDLVNRGPRSADVLRWARDHDEIVTAVLGNHDLHLLARAAGFRKKKNLDTLDEVLEAPDCDDLLEWLRCRPLIHREGKLVLVHAGLLPSWTVARAEKLAAEVQAALSSDDDDVYFPSLEGMYGKGEIAWRDDLAGIDRLRSLAAIFTRLRTCTVDGEPRFDYAGEVENIPAGQVPWYAIEGRQSADHTVIFGHWAAHGLRVMANAIATDSACVWGGSLSAVRLDDFTTYSEPSRE